ncbi:MAG: dihydrofolate reductase family protein, partial [Thiohalocapsa sp.]
MRIPAGMDSSNSRCLLDEAWKLLLAAADVARAAEQSPTKDTDFALCVGGGLRPVRNDKSSTLQWRPATGWCCGDRLDPTVRDFLELYLPICRLRSGLTNLPRGTDTHLNAHLGQSLDGCIATHTGDSEFVTGPENLLHLHRMRALSDAVVVGAGTIASDDPRLTTRLVSGPNPVRVVLDPDGRLGE